MKRRIAVVDADSIIYILAWSLRESTDEDSMRLAVNQFMVDLIVDTEATHYLGVFSPKKTFRNTMNTQRPYKGNRPPSPDWLNFWKSKVIDQCIADYGFVIASAIEADDVLSLSRYGFGTDDEVILCSPDKDMKQIPGTHYNYSKRTWANVTPDEAIFNLWRQILVGDTTDNIPGAKGIGPKTADKLLALPAEDLSRVLGTRYQNTDVEGGELTTMVNPVEVLNDRYKKVVEDTFKKVYGDSWFKYYIESVDLVTLLTPNMRLDLVPIYGRHVQTVLVQTDDEVQGLLNNNDETVGRVLQDSQRSHADDILCPPADISE